jgi:hypothetical protein
MGGSAVKTAKAEFVFFAHKGLSIYLERLLQSDGDRAEMKPVEEHGGLHVSLGRGTAGPEPGCSFLSDAG